MRTITHGLRTAGWAIDDPVIRLRRWGQRDGFDLPAHGDALIVGSAEACTLRIEDPEGSVSRQHAELTREAGIWTLKDLGSKNGSRLDGERRVSFALTPGVEIEIGSVKLVAESARLAELHGFLARILGFGDERLAAVDEALRGVRDAAARRTALLLCGAGRLASTARRIHELAIGTDRPFVVATGSGVRAAVKSATAGTLCVEGKVAATDLAFARAPRSCALILCTATAAEAADHIEAVQRGAIVEVPPLPARSEEHEQLLLAYAQDAARAFGAGSTGFREHELVWLRDTPIANLADAEELTLRLVAERVFGATHGAAKLGITRAALSTYLRRRGIPL